VRFLGYDITHSAFGLAHRSSRLGRRWYVEIFEQDDRRNDPTPKAEVGFFCLFSVALELLGATPEYEMNYSRPITENLNQRGYKYHFNKQCFVPPLHYFVQKTSLAT
jgi:hypothetical protein